jgi:hypothetical protein
MSVEEPSVLRYNALTQLWIHHNTTQLQWPAVVIGAALLVGSSETVAAQLRLLPLNLPFRLPPRQAISPALLLVFTAVGLFALLYTMRRARHIMSLVEAELDLLEGTFSKNGTETPSRLLSHINHPEPRIPSGPGLIRSVMLALSLVMLFSGTDLLFGLLPGLLVTALVFLAYYFHGRKHRQSTSTRGA